MLLWILVTSVCALGAAYYARRFGRLDALLALYVTLVIVANLVAQKIVGYDLLFTTVFAPAATLFFSITFLLADIVTEKFGRQETQRMIYIACGAQLAFLAFNYLAIQAPAAPFYTGEAAFDAVLGAAPRLALAGLVTFFVSESLDTYLYAWFRKVTEGRHLWMRYVFSSIPAMALDSVLFVTLAFAGVQPLLPLIIGLTIIKWLVGLVNIPFMYAARAIVHKN